tara:strand:- start:200 stop:604 length:405 start_codon:yes stop_codon:yes gene_type:complete
MADDTTISNDSNVVKGPWKRAKRVEPSETDKMYEDIEWSEEVTESVMVPLIHNLAENGVDFKTGSFIGEIGFVNETIKSILYRTMGYKHDMTALVEMTMKTNPIGEDPWPPTFNHELVSEIVSKNNNDSEDEPT